MTDKIKIAIDTMGGENSPKKIIEGIKISLKNNKENFFFLYGQKDKIEKELKNNESIRQHCEIVDTNDVILDNESPLVAAKRGKNSSMWNSIESVKSSKAEVAISCGNTGSFSYIIL